MSDEIRYAMLGAGMMGCEHIQCVNAIDGARVVAYADPSPLARSWADGCSDDSVAAYESGEAMLERDDIDVVVISTPNFTHRDIAESVMNRTDAAILLEKPMCTTVEQCSELIELADERSAPVWVAMEYRYMPTISTALGQVSNLGEVRTVAIREHRYPFLEKIDNWNRFNAKTGGTLVEKCCHFFDLMRLFARSDPARVYASGGQDVNHLDELYDGMVPDILDNALVIVDFENGVRGSFDLSMFAEGGRFEQELCIVGDHAKLEATVPGDTVWLGKRHEVGQQAISAPLSDSVGYGGFHHGSSYLEHLDLISALRTESEPKVTVRDGRWAVAVGEAAQRSIARGEPVLMEEFDGLSS